MKERERVTDRLESRGRRHEWFVPEEDSWRRVGGVRLALQTRRDEKFEEIAWKASILY